MQEKTQAGSRMQDLLADRDSLSNLDNHLLSIGSTFLWISLPTVYTFRTRTKLSASRSLQLQDQGISIPCSTLHRKHWHLCFIWFAPNQQLRRQLSNLTSQAKTLNLSTPGGSSNSNLLVFPVLVPDYFADNKDTLNFTSECFLYVDQIYFEKNDSYRLPQTCRQCVTLKTRKQTRSNFHEGNSL
ncbi:hypothetical protein GOODEAATRI_026806 [Goodea atripinnis]|uniref:Uncharacterized protein n=1 Tax=Goodea atripinnis TaxID=208336 RepID=A0ABV0N4J4_9TELE